MSVAEQNLPNDYELIEESGLFDRSFYLRANPDVAEASIDPLVHFCDYGWRGGRNSVEWTSSRLRGNRELHVGADLVAQRPA